MNRVYFVHEDLETHWLSVTIVIKTKVIKQT
jgi:hypothetical protein